MNKRKNQHVIPAEKSRAVLGEGNSPKTKITETKMRR